MSSIICKVKGVNQATKKEEWRRFPVTPGCQLNSLRERVSALFSIPASVDWTFQWTDEEGDVITISENDELQQTVHELLASSKTESAVLRLQISLTEVASKPSGHDEWSPENISEKLLRGISSFVAAMDSPRNKPSRLATAICDVTNQRLVAGSGNWYHLMGSTYDVCREAWSNLSDEAKQKYVQVNSPEDLGDQKHMYLSRCGRFQRCGGSQKRNHKTCPRRHTHIGWCDKTNQVLFPGGGWFHKRGENYDLCEEAFNQLDADSKKQFDQIDKPEDLRYDMDRYSTQKFSPSSMFEAFVEVPEVKQPPSADNESHARESNSEQTEHVVQDAQSEVSTDAVLLDAMTQMEIVAGPSLVRGSKVEANTRLMPVWEIMNTHADPNAIWTDVRVRAREPNVLGVREEGFEVPMLEPGSTGMVCVEFVVPTNLMGQNVVALFDLYDKHGNVFGEPLKLELFVKDAAQEKREALLKSIREMGFTDEAMANAALDRAHENLSDAVMIMLREHAAEHQRV